MANMHYVVRKRRTTRKKSIGARMWRWFLWCLFGMVVIGIISAIGIFWYFAKDLPDASEISALSQAQSTKIYDRTGQHLLYVIHGEEKRTVIPFEQIPSVVKYATIALEDQDFYNHHGIKVTSIVRAALSQVSSRFGRSSGGSTITQQLIKNTLLTPEHSIKRKIREAILSLELERKFTKDEILEMYLNEIPYGSNAYGIQAAARTFFNKDARDLTLDEAAVLASLPQAPSRWSPYGAHPERLIARKNHALDEMVQLGYITQEEAEKAKAEKTLDKTRPNRDDIHAPHFVMYIREYLEAQYEKGEIEEGGLKVYTTLDWEKQQIAEQVVRDGVEKNLRYDATNAALVAIDPKTGQILSMVGSVDFFDKSIDGQVNVATRFRQPGSSFKPYVFLEAFRKGYSPDTILFDVPTKFDDGEDPYEPRNYDGTFRGPIKIKRALGMSLNIPAVKALYLVGVNDAVKLAKQLGLTGLNHPKRYGLALVLGGGEVQLLHHTHAYSTLANGGVRQKLTGILRIEDQDGNILEKYETQDGERVIEEKYVAMLDHVLSTNKYRLPAFAPNNPLRFDDREVAAKTGTTNEYRDAWTMGYTPSIAVGVWVGNNDNHVMKEGAAGSVVAAPIWRAFMNKVLSDQVVEHFPVPDENQDDADDNEEEDSQSEQSNDEENDHLPDKPMLDGKIVQTSDRIKVCRISKKKNLWCLKSDACPKKASKKRKFIDAHTILYYVNRNDVLGDMPKHPEEDPQYKLWEKGVRKYYEKRMDAGEKIILGVVPDKKCKEKDFD